MSSQKILCILQALHVSKKRSEAWKKCMFSLKKKKICSCIFVNNNIYLSNYGTRKVQLPFLCEFLGWNTVFVKFTEVELQVIASLCRTHLQVVFCLHPSFSGSLLEIQHKLNCPKKSILILRVLILKLYVVSIGSSAQHIYITLILLLRQLITSQNTPGRKVFLPHSSSEEVIPQKYWTIAQDHWENKE